MYTCPQGTVLKRRQAMNKDRSIHYQAPAVICNRCPCKARCTPSKAGRTVQRSLDEAYLDRVRGYHETEAYKKAMRKRGVWVEPLFAEAKNWHSLRRFRLRGLVKVNGEALLTASGQNLKRLQSMHGWGRRPYPGGALGVARNPYSSYPPDERCATVSTRLTIRRRAGFSTLCILPYSVTSCPSLRAPRQCAANALRHPTTDCVYTPALTCRIPWASPATTRAFPPLPRCHCARSGGRGVAVPSAVVAAVTPAKRVPTRHQSMHPAPGQGGEPGHHLLHGFACVQGMRHRSGRQSSDVPGASATNRVGRRAAHRMPPPPAPVGVRPAR